MSSLTGGVTGSIITSTGLGSNSNLSTMGSKRGRLLIRQQRIKKDNDQSNTGDLETPEVCYSEYLLSVPTPKIERHASEPSPSSSSQLLSSPSISSQNLLSVPQHYLIKQHSHPLLPSQSQSPPAYSLTRQLSHPLQTTSTITQSTTTTQQSQQQQMQQQMLKQSHMHHHQSAPNLMTQQQMGNPTVVIIPELSNVVSGNELPSQQSSQHLQLPSIRVKSEELQRSVSSPLVRFNQKTIKSNELKTVFTLLCSQVRVIYR